MNWAGALPTDLNDCLLLKEIYAPDIQIEQPILEQLIAAVKGSTRRVSSNLEMMNELALEEGIDLITTKNFKHVLHHGFLTGESPKPRTF
ncbi:hypothetical protein ACFOGQ_14880 [Acinetobacter vivianii]